MKILVIDTAFNACSVCLSDKIVENFIIRSEVIERGHAEKLIPMIDDVIKRSGSDYNELDLIAVISGPGAFTGMRVGISAAKAMAMCLDIKIVGIDSFTAFWLTYNKKYHNHDKNIAIILETKRQDFYFAVLNKSGEFIRNPQCSIKGDVDQFIKENDCIVIGDAIQRLKSELDLNINCDVYEIATPDVGVVAKYISENYMNLARNDNNIAPLYLRGADITMPKPQDRFL